MTFFRHNNYAMFGDRSPTGWFWLIFLPSAALCLSLLGFFFFEANRHADMFACYQLAKGLHVPGRSTLLNGCLLKIHGAWLQQSQLIINVPTHLPSVNG